MDGPVAAMKMAHLAPGGKSAVWEVVTQFAAFGAARGGSSGGSSGGASVLASLFAVSSLFLLAAANANCRICPAVAVSAVLQPRPREAGSCEADAGRALRKARNAD